MEVELTYVLSILVVIGFVYRWLSKTQDYFRDKPIPTIPIKPVIGSTGPLLFKHLSLPEFIKPLYDKYAGSKVVGLFDTNIPMYVLRDPELIKKIAVKDFDHFMDHRPLFGENHPDGSEMLFPKTLFALNDQKWRNMRATLSPAFTGSKMRLMFDLVLECCGSMVKFYQKEIGTQTGREYEMKDVFSRFTNDVIATTAFGIKVDSSQHPDNEFYAQGKKMTQFTRLSVVLRVIGYRLIPSVVGSLGWDIIDQEQREYFSSLIREAVKTRETQGIVRPDMINILMQARKGLLQHQKESEQNEGFATVEESEVGKARVSKQMTETEMIAQCLIFLLAGFDTVSTCLTFLMYELTLNRDVQDKLYEEIMETHQSLNGKSLSYDALQKMKYMDMVVSEGLRMWPPLAAIDRLCVRDYALDDGEGLRFTIDKGAGIWFPIHGLHHDPKYYPSPEKFVPERFSDENKSNINLGAYLPFGIGPRNCIGSRFALMEVKAIVYHMLKSFTFERTRNTEVPLTLKKGFAGTVAEKGVFVEYRPRTRVLNASGVLNVDSGEKIKKWET
ncbi:probable cytochrome P450 9f2 [Sabethes cyaneus]|uniref:probable cytochrome P450 9f2 n=1 Tax=Sabethes cyaneus TaxID=53552 RepID=UPI00237ED707|nr:probable cytochrome P450 9f2 [Sabethes cyaneus]